MERIGGKCVMCSMRPTAHIRTLQGFFTFWRKERNGVKCIMFLLLLLCPILGGAGSEACFYEAGYICAGTAVCCANLGEYVCCKCPPSPSLYGWAADIHPGGGSSVKVAIIYTDNSCLDSAATGYNGYMCVTGDCDAQYFSAEWYDAGETVRNEPCKERVYADTLMYKFITEEGRRASWVLPKGNLSEVDFDPRKLSASQQVDWFKSHGATLEMDDGKIISSNVTDADFSSCKPSY